MSDDLPTPRGPPIVHAPDQMLPKQSPTARKASGKPATAPHHPKVADPADGGKSGDQHPKNDGPAAGGSVRVNVVAPWWRNTKARADGGAADARRPDASGEANGGAADADSIARPEPARRRPDVGGEANGGAADADSTTKPALPWRRPDAGGEANGGAADADSIAKRAPPWRRPDVRGEANGGAADADNTAKPAPARGRPDIGDEANGGAADADSITKPRPPWRRPDHCPEASSSSSSRSAPRIPAATPPRPMAPPAFGRPADDAHWQPQLYQPWIQRREADPLAAAIAGIPLPSPPPRPQVSVAQEVLPLQPPKICRATTATRRTTGLPCATPKCPRDSDHAKCNHCGVCCENKACVVH